MGPAIRNDTASSEQQLADEILSTELSYYVQLFSTYKVTSMVFLKHSKLIFALPKYFAYLLAKQRVLVT